jgi:uncharacterized protein YqjF (DUF2071 family)
MGQTWEHLLFAHWPLAPAAVERHLPASLPLDVRDGQAWIGMTPFRATISLGAAVLAFAEVNVRTYVTLGGRPGIYFFSLDASSRLAVAAARRFYRLPYFDADIEADQDGARTRFTSARTDDRGHAARFECPYQPVGERFTADPGSLEHFLTERYCLYTVDELGAPYRAEIHHPPWSLRVAEAEMRTNTMPPPGLELPATEPLLHYAARQDVLVWRLRRIAAKIV